MIKLRTHATLALLALALTGCEEPGSAPGYSGDPELIAVAEVCPTEQRYGPMPIAVLLQWGGSSYVMRSEWGAGARITIDESMRGTAGLLAHVDHEVAEVYEGYVRVNDGDLTERIDNDHGD